MLLAAAIVTSILLVSCALLLFPAVLFTCLFHKRKKQSITKRTTWASRKQEKLKIQKTQSKSGKTKTDEEAVGSKKKKQKTAEAATALSIKAGKKKKDGGKKEVAAAQEKPNREEKKVLKKQPPPPPKQQEESMPMDVTPEAAGKTKFTIPSCMMSTVPTADEEDYPDELHQQLLKHPEMVVC